MKNKKFIITIILFILSFARVVFAETAIKAEVNKTKITTDEAVTYKIIIISTEKNTPSPTFPKFAGFKVISQIQSSTVSFVKNNVETNLTRIFLLTPINIGKFKIEPSSIKIKGKTYSTEGFEIEITEGKTKPSLPQEKEPASPKGLPSEEQEPPKITL